MESQTWQDVRDYFRTISPCRITLKDVREDMREHVENYQSKYDHNRLPPEAHHNAMVCVRDSLIKRIEKPRGNCPKCQGTGYIRAFRHRAGGVCFKCEGKGELA